MSKEDKENLSSYDLGQVLKNSHNKAEYALDVVQVNDWIPKRFSKVEYTYKDMGDDTKEVEFITFFDFGVRETRSIKVRDYPTGRAHTTVVSFKNQTAHYLNGKYFKIYDDAGSVGIWFNMDQSSTQPTMGTLRAIEIQVSSEDNYFDILDKLITTVGLDSEFNATSVGYYAMLSSISLGPKSLSTSGTCKLIIQNEIGYSSINNTSFSLFVTPLNLAFHVWYNVDGSGVDPAFPSSTPIMVSILSTDDKVLIAQKTMNAINDSIYFKATINNEKLFIENTIAGPNTDLIDHGTEFEEILTTKQGELPKPNCRIQVLFDVNRFITGIQRLI